MSATVRIPLRIQGEIVAHALLDEADERFAEHSWWLATRGYAARRPNNRSPIFYLHREILGLTHGDGLQADHINRDRLDCRRSNLRIVTPAQNGQNRGSKPGSTSQYRGVSWKKAEGKWRAEVCVGGQSHWLGMFTREEEAAAVASAFRREHMPFAVES